ncbi:MAG TPA: transporter, partial [Verrucomicrobiota bacterium]|nr:transporter [Verrucomicrobiota bacterium]
MKPMTFRRMTATRSNPRITKRFGCRAILTLCGALAVAVSPARAAENGIGHYNPGQTADFADALPGFPCFVYENIFTYYDGSTGGSKRMPVSGGRVAANLDATSYTDSSVLLWQTPLKIFGGYYTVFASIPYTWVTVSADVETPMGRQSTSDSVCGIGDIYFAPAAIGWTNGDFKWDVRFGIYAPTGEYDNDRLANPGLGFWTFEPEVSFSWLSSKIGTEVSVFAGFDFNTENTDANYTSGDLFHLDVTIAQHLPLLGGVAGLGANGFWMRKFTGDRGSGATLGSFEMEQRGIGPGASY